MLFKFTSHLSSTFTPQVESVLVEEAGRVSSYLLPSSEAHLLKVIVDVLLTRQQNQVSRCPGIAPR